MRVKSVVVKIESREDFWKALEKKARDMDSGSFPVKGARGVPFPSLEEVRKALTPARLRLLAVIRKKKPASAYELADMTGRTFTNTYRDLKLLESLGFVEIGQEEKKRRALKPRVDYERIQIAIPV